MSSGRPLSNKELAFQARYSSKPYNGVRLSDPVVRGYSSSNARMERSIKAAEGSVAEGTRMHTQIDSNKVRKSLKEYAEGIHDISNRITAGEAQRVVEATNYGDLQKVGRAIRGKMKKDAGKPIRFKSIQYDGVTYEPNKKIPTFPGEISEFEIGGTNEFVNAKPVEGQYPPSYNSIYGANYGTTYFDTEASMTGKITIDVDPSKIDMPDLDVDPDDFDNDF